MQNAVKFELESTGNLLCYHAMQKKLRQIWNLRVAPDLVRDIMYCVDPDASKARAPGAKTKKK